MRSSWIAIAFAVLIGLSVVGVLTVSTRLGEFGGDSSGQTLMHLSDATAAGYDGGTLIWKFRARSIETAKTSPTTTITGISSGTVFDSDGEVFRVAATRAEYDSRAKRLSVQGGVRVEFSDSNRIECASLVWDSKSEVVTSPGLVRLWLGSRGTLSGRRLVVNLESEEIRMDDVKARLRIRSFEGEREESAA